MIPQLEERKVRPLERIARQDLPMETTTRLAQLVAVSDPETCLPTEKELCEQLGVGRSTLREAIRSLAFIGAVQPRQGLGTFVSTPDPRNAERLISLCVTLQRAKVTEVVELRCVLEVEAARLAALQHEPDDRREMEAIMSKMAASEANPAVASRYDLQFHATLARSSHNGLLTSFIHGMRSLLEIWMTRAINGPPVVHDILGEHNAILAAVFERDPEQAAWLMRDHLTNAADRLFSVVGPDQSTASYLSLLVGRP